MKLLNKEETIIKKSKFITYYYEIDHKDEVITILNELKQEHKKAKHIPYAYVINNIAGKTDDKEPTGTAGLPILNILQKNNLNSNLIVIIRYFGGVKLGSSNLLRTYSNCAKEVIKKSL
mgnify:CR=1 FL=1